MKNVIIRVLCSMTFVKVDVGRESVLITVILFLPLIQEG